MLFNPSHPSPSHFFWGVILHFLFVILTMPLSKNSKESLDERSELVEAKDLNTSTWRKK